MRPLDWLKNLKWIRAIREYDLINAENSTLTNAVNESMAIAENLQREILILKEQNYVMEGELNDFKDSGKITTLSKISEGMSKACRLIDEEMNLNISGRPPRPRMVGNQKMSGLTWAEERCLKIELDVLRTKVKHLEERGTIPKTIHGTEV